MCTGIIQKNSLLLIELSQFVRQAIENSFLLRNCDEWSLSHRYHSVHIARFWLIWGKARTGNCTHSQLLPSKYLINMWSYSREHQQIATLKEVSVKFPRKSFIIRKIEKASTQCLDKIYVGIIQISAESVRGIDGMWNTIYLRSWSPSLMTHEVFTGNRDHFHRVMLRYQKHENITTFCRSLRTLTSMREFIHKWTGSLKTPMCDRCLLTNTTKPIASKHWRTFAVESVEVLSWLKSDDKIREL